MNNSKPAPWFVVLSCAAVLTTGVAGCGIMQQRDTEARVRGYFGLPRCGSLEGTNIQSAMLHQFPVGTASTKVQTSLFERGMGGDGASKIWRTNNILGCGPNDYSDGWFSKRRIGVWFVLDGQGEVTNIQVQSFSYGL